MPKKQKTFSINIPLILLCLIIVFASAFFIKASSGTQVQFTAETIISLSGISDGDLSVRANSECASLTVSGSALTIMNIPIANNFILKTAAHNNALKLVPAGGVLDLTLDSSNISANNITQWTLNGSSGTTVAHIVGVTSANTWYAVKTNGVLFNTFQSNSSGEVSFTYNGSWSEKVFTIEADGTAPTAFSLVSPLNNSSVSNSKPTFSWNACSDPDLSHYQLYIDNTLDTDNISGVSTTPTNDLSCGEHAWFVRAADNAGNTTDSGTFNLTMVCGSGFISPAPPVIPLSPNQTFEINIIENEATIDLNNIQNVYQIAISTTPDFKYVSWEPYQEKIALPDVEKVYLKFRSEAGGVSEVYEIETSPDLNAGDSNNPDLPSGSLVRMINDYKVYILNNNYLRHIMNEMIFSFYGHLNKEDIQETDPSLTDNCQESFLIREVNDYKVYLTEGNKKHWLDISVEEFEERYDSWGGMRGN